MIVDIFNAVMGFCFYITKNYGLSIILFTLFLKIVLLPISIWVQKNSIKMVKMQPKINEIHIKYFGNKDMIAEEEANLYKAEKYNAFVSIIPLVAQILLLLIVVEIIKNPSQDALDSGFSFLGINLAWITVENWGLSIMSPIIAGLSSLFLCIAQNKMNVLQAEQSKFNKYSMLIFSVGLSLYLGFFVQAGVALYWTASNLFAILQQYLLNLAINPKKFVDYKELERTRKELKEIEKLSKTKTHRTPEQIKKERADYKRFFSIANKKLVFYSEGSGFYKYYKGIIEYILQHTNLTIHYITSDYNDQIFDIAKTEAHIKPYYIGEHKLITLMMKLDTDVMVMTMPDIENYHIKRSLVRKDIEYIFIPHSMDSLNMTMRYKSTDHYDTVFSTGKYQTNEYEETNQLHHLENRKIIHWGYTLLDDMIAEYKKSKKTKKKQKEILIAPSWQKDNIVDSCLNDLLDSFKNTDYKIIVRPHPQHVRHMKNKFEKLKEQFKDNTNVIIQTDFSSNDTVWNADLMITDWSGIAYEYAFTTKRPVIFIDTPMKVMNPNYKELKEEPFNIWAREELGAVIKIKDVKDTAKVVQKILKNASKYTQKLEKLTEDSVYNLGASSKVGAKYIISSIQNKIKERKNQ